MCELIISSNSIYVMMSNGDRERKREREREMKKSYDRARNNKYYATKANNLQFTIHNLHI